MLYSFWCQDMMSSPVSYGILSLRFFLEEKQTSFPIELVSNLGVQTKQKKHYARYRTQIKGANKY